MEARASLASRGREVHVLRLTEQCIADIPSSVRAARDAPAFFSICTRNAWPCGVSRGRRNGIRQ